MLLGVRGGARALQQVIERVVEADQRRERVEPGTDIVGGTAGGAVQHRAIMDAQLLTAVDVAEQVGGGGDVGQDPPSLDHAALLAGPRQHALAQPAQDDAIGRPQLGVVGRGEQRGQRTAIIMASGESSVGSRSARRNVAYIRRTTSAGARSAT